MKKHVPHTKQIRAILSYFAKQYYKLYKLHAYGEYFYKPTVGVKQYMYNVKNTTPTTPSVYTLPQSYALKNHTNA